MKIGGDYGVDPRHNTWPVVAKDLGVDVAAALDRVLALAQRAPDAFAEAARSADVAAVDRPLSTRLVALVTERSERCQAILLKPAHGPTEVPEDGR
jgi:hypothetical protein